jgi:hypothetical protein
MGALMAIWLVPPPRDRPSDIAATMLALIVIALAVGTLLGEVISEFIR